MADFGRPFVCVKPRTADAARSGRRISAPCKLGLIRRLEAESIEFRTLLVGMLPGLSVAIVALVVGIVRSGHSRNAF